MIGEDHAGSFPVALAASLATRSGPACSLLPIHQRGNRRLDAKRPRYADGTEILVENLVFGAGPLVPKFIRSYDCRPPRRSLPPASRPSHQRNLLHRSS